jgi:hypothetical protein
MSWRQPRAYATLARVRCPATGRLNSSVSHAKDHRFFTATLLSSCSEPQFEISGTYMPSHEGNIFIPCGSSSPYLIQGDSWTLVKARSAADKNDRASAYIEAIATHADFPDSDYIRSLNLKGSYKIITVNKAIPTDQALGKCGHG